MEKQKPVYVASRASVPQRAKSWRILRAEGAPITSTWIDEDGEGQTNDLGELWERITSEIAESDSLILYAEAGDFPLKGALIEAGIALGMGKPVIVCLPTVDLDEHNCRPIGSWIKHPLVSRIDDLRVAVSVATGGSYQWERQQPRYANGSQVKQEKNSSGPRAESRVPRPAQPRSVNPNAVWDSSRCADLSTLEYLIREVSMINGGNRCLERIANCIEMAKALDTTTYEPVRYSFLQFLNRLAIDDRFGSVNETERDAETTTVG